MGRSVHGNHGKHHSPSLGSFFKGGDAWNALVDVNGSLGQDGHTPTDPPRLRIGARENSPVTLLGEQAIGHLKGLFTDRMLLYAHDVSFKAADCGDGLHEGSDVD